MYNECNYNLNLTLADGNYTVHVLHVHCITCTLYNVQILNHVYIHVYMYIIHLYVHYLYPFNVH